MAGEPTTSVTRVVGRGLAAVRRMRGCTVEISSGPSAGARVRMEHPRLRVGSHPTNDLVLDDETVSRHHLEIAVEPDGYRVTDLGSSNGTIYHAAGSELRLGEALVSARVVLTLGDSTLTLTPGGDEAEVPTSTHDRFGSLRGQSVAMRELFAQLEAVARADCAVLLEGETGCGKERVAESLHRESARARGPWVIVDCGAIAGGLLESELFGHVRGAFTGADHDRKGLVELADGGTLFLDEVGELPLGLQAKLLGVLERKKVTPVGTATSRPVDVRVLAATHRNLARAVNQGQFRADLYYRLAVVRLRVPSLRERLDDLPLLIDEMLAELRAREGEAVPETLSAVALARLAAQPWPGNLRELRNTVESAVLQIPRPSSEGPSAAPPSTAPPPLTISRALALAGFHQRYFAALLDDPRASYSSIARSTGLDRRYLRRILRKHNLTLPDGEE